MKKVRSLFTCSECGDKRHKWLFFDVDVKSGITPETVERSVQKRKSVKA